MIDSAIFEAIWWLFVSLNLIGFATMNCHDMGVGMLLPFVGRTDAERTVILISTGPNWEENQIWFLASGSFVFAAWPLVYENAYSGLYWNLLAVFSALSLRPVGCDCRSRINNLTLRAIWDCGLFLGGAVPPFIFGVIIGNLMQGIPLALDGDINPYYSENIWHLLNPYALLAGFVSSAMIAMQGGVYLANQTNSVIQDRAIRVAIVAALFMMIVFIGAEIWFQHIQESRTASAIGASSISTPITTLTAIAYDGWTANCVQHSLVWILPAFSIMAGALVSVLHRFRQSLIGFFASSIAIAGVVGTMGAAVLPLLLSCSKVHNTRLDIWNSVSSHFNLPAMSWSTIVLIPFIVIYILWVLRVVREKDSKAFIHANNYRG